MPLKSGILPLLGDLEMPGCIRDAAPDTWGRRVIINKLLESADRVEKGIPLTPDLDQALFHGSSVGGARPKALIEDNGVKYIAKFSSGTDLYNVVKAEYIAMRLAGLAGLDVAPVKLVQAAGKDVLSIFKQIESVIRKYWDAACEEAQLTEIDKNYLWKRQFLNPFSFEK